MSTCERDLLELALAAAPPGAGREGLRRQAATAFVTGECGCGCGSVRLGVDCAVPAVACDDGVLVETRSRPPGARIVQIHVRGGYLSGLELPPDDPASL